jgi:SAM-dependent methyltransferase
VSWHLPRFVKTFSVLETIVLPRQRWLDVSSDPWFCLLARQELRGPDITPTALEAEEITFHSGSGEASYHYQALPLEIRPDTTTFGLGDNYDLVTAFEVLEHIQFHPAPFLAGVNQALRVGGRLVLTTPNASSWFALNRMLDGGCTYQTYQFGGPMTHRKEYTTWETKRLLETAGFQVDSIATFNCYPNDRIGLRSTLLWLGMLLWHAATLQAVRTRNLLVRSGTTQIVVATKTGPCDPAAVASV